MKTKKKSSNKCTEKIHGILIDPYLRTLTFAEMSRDIGDWHRMLRCDCMGVRPVASGKYFDAKLNRVASLDLWFDDEFLCKDILAPSFRVLDPDNEQRSTVIAGYGWLCCSLHDGESACLHLSNAETLAQFGQWLHLAFEDWEHNPVHCGQEYIEERMRCVSSEMPGKFSGIFAIEGVLK